MFKQMLKVVAGMGLVLCLATTGFAQASADTLVVTGVVVESGTDTGIADATVIVSQGGFGGQQGTSDTLQTDVEGAFTLVTLNANANFNFVAVTATADGYGTGVDQGFIRNPDDGEVDTVEVSLSLVSGASPPSGDSLYVSGTVTDTAGNAIEGATVTVSLARGAAGGETTTDSDGAYEVAAVNSAGSGNVTISVAALGYSNDMTRASLTEPSDGTPDTVGEDFELVPIEPGDSLHVTGNVTDTAGQPVEGATVTVTMGVQEVSGVTGADGNYEIATININAISRPTISVVCAGYEDESRRATIAEPADGAADSVSRDFQMVPGTSSGVNQSPVQATVTGDATYVKVYGLNGRHLGTFRLGAGDAGLGGLMARSRVAHQPLILMYMEGGRMVRRTVLTGRP